MAPPIAAMRAVAAATLGPDDPLPRFDELADRTDQLRRHLRDLIPAVEDAAGTFAYGCQTDQALAQFAAEGARAMLSADPGPGLVSATAYARGLARELRALCDHYESMADARAGEPA